MDDNISLWEKNILYRIARSYDKIQNDEFTFTDVIDRNWEVINYYSAHTSFVSVRLIGILNEGNCGGMHKVRYRLTPEGMGIAKLLNVTYSRSELDQMALSEWLQCEENYYQKFTRTVEGELYNK